MSLCDPVSVSLGGALTDQSPTGKITRATLDLSSLWPQLIMISKMIIPQSVFTLAVVVFTLVLRPSSVLESFYTSSPLSKAVRPISPIALSVNSRNSLALILYTPRDYFKVRTGNLETSDGKRLLSARCLPNWTFSLKIIQHGLYVLAFIDSDCCQERPEVVTLDGAPI
jgi:hypothetical protein